METIGNSSPHYNFSICDQRMKRRGQLFGKSFRSSNKHHSLNNYQKMKEYP